MTGLKDANPAAVVRGAEGPAAEAMGMGAAVAGGEKALKGAEGVAP